MNQMPSLVSTRSSRYSAVRPARGFGAVAAIVILVMLASLAAAIVRLTWVQQVNAASDLAGANALQAAGAGVEWGLFQSLTTGGSWVGCSNSSQTLDLRASMGVLVTVTCQASSAYVEGADATGTPRAVRVMVIDAVACNGSTSCPDDTQATSMAYVERKRQVTITDKNTNE